MCPLRVILIFLSATLAGFFLLRNLKSQPQLSIVSDGSDKDPGTPVNAQTSDSSTSPPVNRSSKVISAIELGFWSCVDMASGRYLWRHLVSKRST